MYNITVNKARNRWTVWQIIGETWFKISDHSSKIDGLKAMKHYRAKDAEQ